MTMRARLLLTLLSAGLVATAGAATQQDLARVEADLRRVAAPWCGRLAELDAQGRRHCTVPFESFGSAGAGNAFAFLGKAGITDELLTVLSVDELAAVMGHELAHLVLGHGLFRLRQQLAAAPGAPGNQFLPLLEQSSVEPHSQTPADPRAQELDADTLGLVFAGMAGHDVRRGAALWRTAARRVSGWAAHGSATHPDTVRRLANATAVADAFCRAAAASRPPWPAAERLLPAYELSRDEARQQLDRAALARACGSALPRKTAS
jgi:Zn-dependent protease with chaperone function